MQQKIKEIGEAQKAHGSRLCALEGGHADLYKEVHKRASTATIWAAAAVFAMIVLASAGGLAWWVKEQNSLLKRQVQVILTESFDPDSSLGRRFLDRLFADADFEKKVAAAVSLENGFLVGQAPGTEPAGKMGELKEHFSATEKYRASFAKAVLNCDRQGASDAAVNRCIDRIDIPVAPLPAWVAEPDSDD